MQLLTCDPGHSQCESLDMYDIHLEGPEPRHDHPKMSWSGWVVGGDTQSVNMHVLYDYHKGNQGTFHVHVCGMNGIPTESHHSWPTPSSWKSMISGCVDISMSGCCHPDLKI